MLLLLLVLLLLLLLVLLLLFVLLLVKFLIAQLLSGSEARAFTTLESSHRKKGTVIFCESLVLPWRIVVVLWALYAMSGSLFIFLIGEAYYRNIPFHLAWAHYYIRGSLYYPQAFFSGLVLIWVGPLLPSQIAVLVWASCCLGGCLYYPKDFSHLV